MLGKNMSKNDHTENGNLPQNVFSGQELSKKEITYFANTFAVSFQGYPLFEYFSGHKYSMPKMGYFFILSLTLMRDFSYFASSDKTLHSAAVIQPCDQSRISVWRYIRSGNFRILFKLGIPSAIRMLRFESFAERIKDKYVSSNCWYFYALVTLPEHRGQGFASKVMRDVLRFLDENQQDCYLETMDPKNVKIYERYGFELKEATKFPHADFTLYAMVRTFKKTDDDI